MIFVLFIFILIINKFFNNKIEHYDALLKREKGNYSFFKTK